MSKKARYQPHSAGETKRAKIERWLLEEGWKVSHLPPEPGQLSWAILADSQNTKLIIIQPANRDDQFDYSR